MRKRTTSEFIEQAKKVHGDRYNYSKSNYKSATGKVIIICEIHGIFEQQCNHHLSGSGCKVCGFSESGLTRKRSTLYNKFTGIIQPDDYKLIPVSSGLFAIVDNDDFKNLNRINWRLSNGYAKANIEGENAMHRIIMAPAGGLQVDHIDRNRLNNRRLNLRICTSADNKCNRGPIEGTSSIYKGASIRPDKRWCATIRKHGKEMYIGIFDTEIEAAQAYDMKAKELHGEFAYLNFK